MNLPFVSEEILNKLDKGQVDLQAVYDDLAINNPHLLTYIYGFFHYLKETDQPLTRDKAINLVLSVCLLLKEAHRETGEVTER